MDLLRTPSQNPDGVQGDTLHSLAKQGVPAGRFILLVSGSSIELAHAEKCTHTYTHTYNNNENNNRENRKSTLLPGHTCINVMW